MSFIRTGLSGWDMLLVQERLLGSFCGQVQSKEEGKRMC